MPDTSRLTVRALLCVAALVAASPAAWAQPPVEVA